MYNFDEHYLGNELKIKLINGYDIVRISRWAYGILLYNRNKLSPEIQDILEELGRMEDDSQFEYTETDLYQLAYMLISNDDNPLQ